MFLNSASRGFHALSGEGSVGLGHCGVVDLELDKIVGGKCERPAIPVDILSFNACVPLPVESWLSTILSAQPL